MEVDVEVEVAEAMVEEAVAARRHLQPHLDVHFDAARPPSASVSTSWHSSVAAPVEEEASQNKCAELRQNCAELRGTLRDLRRLGARQRDARLDDAGAHRRHLVGDVVE